MFWLRSCPRCQGDFYQEQDSFGYYLICLQCGHEVQLARRLTLDDRLSPELLNQVKWNPNELFAESNRKGRPHTRKGKLAAQEQLQLAKGGKN